MESCTPIVRRAERPRVRLLVAWLAIALLAAACGGRSHTRVVVPVSFQEPGGAAAPQYPGDFTSHEADRARRRRHPDHATLGAAGSRAGHGLRVLVARGVRAGAGHTTRASRPCAPPSSVSSPSASASAASSCCTRGRTTRRPRVAAAASPTSSRTSSQIELAQGEGRAEQWLAEGMAEWVAFTVLDRLGLDTLATGAARSPLGIARAHPAVTAAPSRPRHAGLPPRVHGAPPA